MELSGSSSGDFEALVDLIVKEQFINECSEKLAVYLLKRGPKDLVELTTWAQQYLIAHKQQLGGKTKSTVQPERAEQRRQTQSKLDTTQGRRGRYKDQKNQKKTRAMVAKSYEDGEEAFACVNVDIPRSSGNSKKSSLSG